MRGEIVQERLVLGAQWPEAYNGLVARLLEGFEMLRIRCDRQSCCTGILGGRDAQPGIERIRAGGVRELWVDVELADLRVIGRELTDAD